MRTGDRAYCRVLPSQGRLFSALRIAVPVLSPHLAEAQLPRRLRAWTAVPSDLNNVILGMFLRLSVPLDRALIMELLGQRVGGRG